MLIDDMYYECGGRVCLVAGWLNWPQLAQLESGVGGWDCTLVVRWLISAPQVKSATGTRAQARAR